MGQIFGVPTNERNNNLPNPILTDELLKNETNARSLLCHSMSTHGYSILRISDNRLRDLILKTRKDVSEFFDKDFEEKSKFHLPDVDDGLFVRKKNRGYINQEEKEYLKIRMVDEKENFPENVFDSFQECLEEFYKIVLCSFLRLAQGPSAEQAYPNFYEEEFSKEEFKIDENYWIVPSQVHIVKEFIKEGSSVSVIRYFKRSEEDFNLHIPCSEHFDTGVLTCILVSEVPGLEVVDQATGEWTPVEQLAQPGDLFLIMGRKIDILKEPDTPLTPTFHRVRTQNNIERHSILFFFDLPNGQYD